jgi:hypothetical protein
VGVAAVLGHHLIISLVQTQAVQAVEDVEALLVDHQMELVAQPDKVIRAVMDILAIAMLTFNLLVVVEVLVVVDHRGLVR